MALDLSGRSSDAVTERKALVRLLDRGVEDPWLRVAVGTMKADPPHALITDLLEHWKTLKTPPAGGAELIEQLCEVAGSQLEPKPAKVILEKLFEFQKEEFGETSIGIMAAGVRGLGRGAERHGLTFSLFRNELSASERDKLQLLISNLQTIAAAQKTVPQQRLAAIKTLPLGEGPETINSLLELALAGSEIPIRLAAIEALGRVNDPSVGPKVMAAYDAQTPQLRRAMLDLMLGQESRTALLVDSLEKGSIKVSEIDPTRQVRLTKHRNKELSARAEKLFNLAAAPDRVAVLASYQSALEQKGDPAKGRAVFEKNCVTCHRVANVGVNVGPDIGDTRDKLPAYLLMNILDPNRAVDANYFGYTLITKQGKPYTGLIKSETAVSITMRLPEGKEETILRSDVDELKTNGLSLMPVGFEKNISIEQMADLISFLKNWRYLDGTIPMQQ